MTQGRHGVGGGFFYFYDFFPVPRFEEDRAEATKSFAFFRLLVIVVSFVVGGNYVIVLSSIIDVPHFPSLRGIGGGFGARVDIFGVFNSLLFLFAFVVGGVREWRLSCIIVIRLF